MSSIASICAVRERALSIEADPEVLHLWRSDSAFPLSPDDLVLRDGASDSAVREDEEDCLEHAVRAWCEDVHNAHGA